MTTNDRAVVETGKLFHCWCECKLIQTLWKAVQSLMVVIVLGRDQKCKI